MILFFTSCKKYLDKKPDKKLVVLSSLKDMQSLLDNSVVMNSALPNVLQIAADDYYLALYDEWASRSPEEQGNYIWDPATFHPNNWGNCYQTVYYSNLILDNIDKIELTNNSLDNWKSIKGSALFFRGFSFFHLAQAYCKPYLQGAENADPGIVLRLNSDFNEVSVRSTVQQTYSQVINDLKQSVSLLPVTTLYKTRPNKAAAFGALARVYLSIEDYVHAGLYADSSLSLYSTLMDYRNMDSTATVPFQMFNSEVIFHSWSTASILNIGRAKVDSDLYKSYASNDIRKRIFFMSNGNGTYYFKGNYTSLQASTYFNGIATDEIYLIKAECQARQGNLTAALDALATLLQKRYRTPVSVTASTTDEALAKVLDERRKELLFRGIRWSDLRRLNRDPRFAKTLTRVLKAPTSTQTYTLPPNDLRYVLLIPPTVIALSGIQQNPR